MATLTSWLPWGGTTTPAPLPPPPAPLEPSSPSLPPPTGAASLPPEPINPTRRALRQLSLPILGSAFLLLSLRLTRRSTVRRRLAAIPPYYNPNNQPPVNPPSGALDAVEALQLATLNVFSVAMVLVGGGAFAFDISTMEELREKFRASERGEEWEGQKRAAEEEFEEWVVGVLARKELKEKVKKELEEKK